MTERQQRLQFAGAVLVRGATLIGGAVGLFGFFIAPLPVLISRKHEFEADAYAVAQTSGADLTAALLKLYAFGDSLSDSGNAYAITAGVFPPSPPYAQRETNGPVAVEWLAAQLGIAFAPSVFGGTNYAVAGASSRSGSEGRRCTRGRRTTSRRWRPTCRR